MRRVLGDSQTHDIDLARDIYQQPDGRLHLQPVRVMPGGRVELCTHDFDLLAKEYLEATPEGKRLVLRSVYGGQTFPSDFHRCGYNFDTLSKALTDVGFVNVKRVNPSCTWECAGLTVEAFKPQKLI